MVKSNNRHREPTLQAIINDTCPRYRMTPVERAVARQKWSGATLRAHLQALAGEDWRTVIEHVASLTYIIGSAAEYDKLPETADLRIVHGAARTAVDAVSYESLTHMQRGALEAGLLAVERLHPKLSDHALRRASVMAQMLIQAKSGIHWCDFQQFVKE